MHVNATAGQIFIMGSMAPTQVVVVIRMYVPMFEECTSTVRFVIPVHLQIPKVDLLICPAVRGSLQTNQ